jgi:hypothetical protein
MRTRFVPLLAGAVLLIVHSAAAQSREPLFTDFSASYDAVSHEPDSTSNAGTRVDVVSTLTRDVPAWDTDHSSMRLETWLIIGGSAADIASTDWPTARPLNELNPYLPNHRAWNAVGQAATTTVVVLLVRHYGPQHPKLARTLAWMLAGVGAADTANNLRTRTR